MNIRPERLELRGSQRLLLELIRRHAPVTRAELARLSNLTAGAITQQCRELIFAGLVVEGNAIPGSVVSHRCRCVSTLVVVALLVCRSAPVLSI